MNSKAFMFSIDALLALTVIILASLVFLFVSPKADSELLTLENQRIKTNDEAIVSFYTHVSGIADPQGFLNDHSTAYCSKSFGYNIATGTVSENYFCEGK